MRLNALLILSLFASSYSFAAETTPTDVILNGEVSATETFAQEITRLQNALNRLDKHSKAAIDAQTNLAKASNSVDIDTFKNLTVASWNQLLQDEKELTAAKFPLLQSQHGFAEALAKHVKAKDYLANVRSDLVNARQDLAPFMDLAIREKDLTKLENRWFDTTLQTREDLDAVVRNGMSSAKFAERIASLKKVGKVAGVGAALVGTGVAAGYLLFSPDSPVSSHIDSQDSAMAGSLRNLAADPNARDSRKTTMSR